MGSVVQHAPRFSERDAIQWAREVFGVRGSAQPLPSERDQNFLLCADSGERFVLKIANARESREVLELQNRAMRRVASRCTADARAGRVTDDGRSPCAVTDDGRPPCPGVRSTVDGEDVAVVHAADGTTHFVRLLTYLPGIPLARFRPHRPPLMRSLGGLLGRVDRALEDFDHPAAHRDFHWNLENAARIVRDNIDLIDDPERRALVERIASRFERDVLPALAELRRTVIHNDGNDHNVLVEWADPWSATVTGVIDFGDMLHTWTAAGPAIAAAYAMLDKADPLAAASGVVAGYHAALALTESEIAAVFPLARMRLAMSVCLSAHQRRQARDNDYLSISEGPAWKLLARLAEIHPRFAECVFREACGLTPCTRTPRVVAWLESNETKFGPVVEHDLAGDDAVVIDLGVAALDPGQVCAPVERGGHATRRPDTAALERLLRERLESEGARVGIGPYDEARSFYFGEPFATERDEFPERRTIHLGIDVFAEPGTPVLAPLDGVVHSFRKGGADLDYGSTILLEHRIEGDGGVFYTLYGHLGAGSLDGLQAGAPVSRGATIGAIGDAAENGGWPPHLHFQVVVDLLDLRGGFPGVAEPSRRAVWLALCPDPNLILRIPPERFPAARRSPAEILDRRRARLGPSLSLAYRRPLNVVSAFGLYLYDERGQAYLDAVNNVPHVGHGHPRVVRAARDQMGRLNTNTRYLHETIVRYAERLCATMPEPLGVCFFVCSGSEANDLALRMARVHTGQTDVITVEGAYHGHTQALIEVSPYKFDGPGGEGAPPHVHVVPVPDSYRGRYRDQDPGAGAKYASHIQQAISEILEEGRRPSALIAEPILGCAGQIVPPAGYLEQAYRHVRDAGGVCIADEVQVGFGRVGTDFWGFQAQGVVPDIVTLGKPIGNGHPLAAVVTTPEIASSFANGMEYFNTFGGNPVSCAIGMAVLDVIEDERLQDNALRVGGRLRADLQRLQRDHPLVGDVRGRGLFLGVELVLDRETLAPATGQAAYVAERLREHGVLVGIDGPHRNVLKIKPPIVFNDEAAERLVRTLDRVLGETCLQPDGPSR